MSCFRLTSLLAARRPKESRESFLRAAAAAVIVDGARDEGRVVVGVESHGRAARNLSV